MLDFHSLTRECSCLNSPRMRFHWVCAWIQIRASDTRAQAHSHRYARKNENYHTRVYCLVSCIVSRGAKCESPMFTDLSSQYNDTITFVVCDLKGKSESIETMHTHRNTHATDWSLLSLELKICSKMKSDWMVLYKSAFEPQHHFSLTFHFSQSCSQWIKLVFFFALSLSAFIYSLVRDTRTRFSIRNGIYILCEW